VPRLFPSYLKDDALKQVQDIAACL